MVTHELRTPLAVVRAYTELLAEEPPLDGRESRDVGAARPAGGLVSRRRWSRSRGWTGWSTRSSPPCGSARSRPRTSRRRTSARSSSEAATELAPLLARHRLELATGIRLFALTDPSRLRQILEHLVENAVKYAPPDTTITLDWRMAEGGVRIGVADEGPGIPEEWRERIFEPYARRETHTARGSGHRAVRGAAARGIRGRAAVVRAGEGPRRASS